MASVWQHQAAMPTRPKRSDTVNGATAAGVVAARPQLMRAMNEQMLLEQVRAASPISRADLARLSGLSKPTVAVALANLEHDGLVRVAGQRTGVRGPAALLYEVRPEAGYVLGLDVGREYLRGALADLTGAVRAKASHRAHSASAHSRVTELQSLADDLTATAAITRARVTQVVIGSPGVYDPGRGALTMARNLPGWERPETIAELRRAFGRSTVVENDVDLAALAERDHGHGRNVDTFAFVSVGTGVGMGLVLGGRLFRGAHGAAGEIAYLPIGDGVDLVEARRRGTFEAAASASGIVRAARQAGMRAGGLSARRVFAAAAEGDARAIQVVRAEAELIAKALGSVIAVIDPELVVLGGGVGRAPGFAGAVAEALEPIAAIVPEIRVSALADDAVVEGCLAAGLELAWATVMARP
jgi:predicted NBD/HSP70 family sugar kinase